MNHTLREHQTLAAVVSRRRSAMAANDEPAMTVGAILRSAALGLLCWAAIIGLVTAGWSAGRWIVSAFAAAIGG